MLKRSPSPDCESGVKGDKASLPKEASKAFLSKSQIKTIYLHTQHAFKQLPRDSRLKQPPK
jgi:hypothetical protein